MKILMVNKFYYVKGGSETYLFGLKSILEKNGHEVIPFSMKDKRNYHTEYEKYFIDNIDYSNMRALEKIKGALKIIYNVQAKRRIEKLLNDVKPDIVHLHIFQHQISPSILKPIKKRGIPIVYTMHDLKPICLNYKMLNNGQICEACKGDKYYKCAVNRCVKNSRFKSLVNVVEGYVHKLLKSYSLIDMYITPSEFYKDKLIEYGLKSEKVEFIPNFIDLNEFEPYYDNDKYYLYLGRLSDEKGIITLIKSFEKFPDANLKIVGTGPMEAELREYTYQNKIKNIKFEGFKQGEELASIIKKAKFLIIPSEWYENCPMSVIEAMAYGTPVIGADIGGIPELIGDDGGYVFKSKDIGELNNILRLTINLNDEEMRKISKASRKRVEDLYGQDKHYSKIVNIYNNFMEQSKKK